MRLYLNHEYWLKPRSKVWRGDQEMQGAFKEFTA